MRNINEVLSPAQLADYRNKGFSDQDIQEALNEVDRDDSQSNLQQSYQRTIQSAATDPRAIASNSMFGSNPQQDLVKWQLELDSILERVEHMLRGDRVSFKDGHLMWIPSKNDKDKVLNDFGVNELMKILSMYLNRNTILSNYDEDTINVKVFDFGNDVSDLIYLKYESMGLSDLEKRKLYPMLVRMMVDVVHSSYLRALHGGERQGLRENMSVIQQQPMMPMQMPTQRGLLNPMRYMGGKYKY